MNSLSKDFRAWREENGMAQHEVADAIGVSQHTISRFERLGAARVDKETSEALAHLMMGSQSKSKKRSASANRTAQVDTTAVVDFDGFLSIAEQLGCTVDHDHKMILLP